MKIELKNVNKSFGDERVLDGFSAVLEGRVCLTGDSGRGKTTVLRLILGLEKPDSGEINGEGRFGVCFQENRLFDDLTAIENIRLACGIKNAEEELLRLLPREVLSKPVRKLSGGQRRRVAVVRAMSAEADGYILDEPFAGLDAESREKTLAYILEKAGDKLLVLALHEADIPAGIPVIKL